MKIQFWVRGAPDRRQVLAVLAGLLMAALVYAGGVKEAQLEEGYLLDRPEPGLEARTEELVVDGPEGESVIPVEVTARKYSPEEAAAEMDRIADRLGEELMGGNISPEEVRSPLVFAGTGNDAVTAEWRPEDTDYIESDGTVRNGGLPEEGLATGVKLILRTEDMVREYYFPVRLYPPDPDGESRFARGLEQEIKRADGESPTESRLALPESYMGEPLRYRRKTAGDWMLFPVLGFGAAAMMPLLDRQREKEKKKERDLQMMRDYPEIISRLVVYSGAGLPVRKAWERIVAEYERTEGGHAAYDEMAKAWHMMQRGVPELTAYESFAAACRSLPYRKMAGLLSQNIRNGSEKMREALELEMENAFEQRKNLARRQGEQASTRLLLPLLLMLMIVMVMVSVPAFLAFGL